MHGTRPLELQEICLDTWRDKYRYGEEASYAGTCARVVDALVSHRDEPGLYSEAFRALTALEAVPAGRILAGAGTTKRVTLINCYVSPDIQDSMQTYADRPGTGIMHSLSKAAYTQQMGGGIGMDFSTVRPRGAVVKRTQSISSGVLPFMDMWNAMCSTIRSSGSRRGAMMATLGVWHPDVEEFIAAKQQGGRLENFNVSVLVSDAFMRAVADDSMWHLTFPIPLAGDDRGVIGFDDASEGRHDGYVYKIVRARDLWRTITESTYVHAEPGVIFIDRINTANNLQYCEEIHCTNPCGEQPLPANGACNLGHTNLAVMVDDPFSGAPKFCWDKLDRAARVMVNLLDRVLDVTQWPTHEQEEEGRNKRRIGLGFTGLASALQQLGVPYGSDEAVQFTREVARRQAIAAYKASIELARERGPFPMYDRDKFMDAPFVRKVIGGDLEMRSEMHKYGIRNGVLLSVAPTGTTSLVIGNVSSGIEPVFAHRYKRKVRGSDDQMTKQYESVYDYGYLKWCEFMSADPETHDDGPIKDPETGRTHKALPDSFVTADQLTVEQHLQMAAAAQEWTDAAISKTINCPTSMSLEEFQQVYTRAYALGLKGCTTYRPDPRSKRGAVLETHDSKGGANEVAEAKSPHDNILPVPPPLDKVPMRDVVGGRRYRIKWPHEDCAYYVFITDYVDSAGRQRPFELFISTKSERHSEWVKAFSLMVTAIFRREGDPTFVVDELKTVFAATGGTWVRVPWQAKPKLAPSLVAAIGIKIEEHLRWLGMIAPDDAIAADMLAEASPTMPAADLLDVCYSCGAKAVIYAEGCASCHACGRSDCG